MLSAKRAHLHLNTKCMVELVSRASVALPNLNLKFLGNEQLYSARAVKNSWCEEPDTKYALDWM